MSRKAQGRFSPSAQPDGRRGVYTSFMGIGVRFLTALSCGALIAAACPRSAQAVAVRVPVVIPDAPALQMRIDFQVSGPAAAGLPQLTAPNLALENGAGGVLWKSLPVQIGLALPMDLIAQPAVPLSALADPAHGPFQSQVFGRARTALRASGLADASVASPDDGLGGRPDRTDEQGLARLLARLEAAGKPSPESDRLFDGASARLASLGFPSQDIAEARVRLMRLGEVLADPAVPVPVRRLLLHNSALATALAGKPVTELPLPRNPSTLQFFRSPEGAEALRGALARVSPELDAVLTAGEALLFDRGAVAATANAEPARRSGFDFGVLLAHMGDRAAFREALNAVYAGMAEAEQGLLFGYPLSAVNEFRGLGAAPAPFHTVAIHGGAGVGEVLWSTVDPLHPDSMRKILWYAGVLDHVAAYLRGRLG